MIQNMLRKAMVAQSAQSFVSEGKILQLQASTYVSGTTWSDESSSGWNASLVNGPTFTSGAAPYFTLDGTNDRIEIPISGTYSAMTMQIVVQRLATWTAYRGIFYHRGTSGATHGISVAPTSNRLGYTWNNNRWDYDGGATLDIAANTWMLLTMRVNSTNAKVSVNTTTTTQTVAASSATFGAGGINTMVGVDTNNLAYLNMRVGVVLAYDRFLTDAEVATNYTAISGTYS